MKKINFIALGGLGEVFKKLFVYDIDGDLFIFDSGMKYPEDVLFGIDTVIPDMSYLKNNAQKIQGVFISNLAEVNIGSLQQLLEITEAKVFGSQFTIEYLKRRFPNKVEQFRYIHPGKTVQIKDVKIKSLHLTYSIPENYGYALDIDGQSIVHVTNFVFNQNAKRAFQTDMLTLVEQGKKANLALFLPVTSASVAGYAANQHQFKKKFFEAIEFATGSIFVSIFTENFMNVQEIIEVAESVNKKICFIGKKGFDLYFNALKQRKIHAQRDTIINIKKSQEMRDETIYLVMGDDGVPYNLMQSILLDARKEIKIRQQDFGVVAVPKIAGAELKVSAMIDGFFQKNIALKIIDSQYVATDIAAQEDIKFLYNLLQPKYLIPTSAEYRQVVEFEKMMLNHGVDKERLLFVDNGEWLSFVGDEHVTSDMTNLQLNDVLVDGKLEEDINNIVLKERGQLASDGVAILTVALKENVDKKEVTYVYFESKGFIPQKDQKQLIADIHQSVYQAVNKMNEEQKSLKMNMLKKKLQDCVGQVIYQKLKRNPIIVIQFVIQN